MSFLPVVLRELQAASHRPATFHLRVLVGGAASLLAMAFLLFSGVSPATMGRSLFRLLAGAGLAFALFEGIRATADSLAEERREGTLGLLFLTDLRPHDIVLGKFAAAAAVSFTALFAAFPAMSLPLLMGGVTAGEFWRVMLVLVTVLAWSLAAGLWMSARCRSALAAMGATALLLTATSLGLWALRAPPGPSATGWNAWWSGPVGALRKSFDATFMADESGFFAAVIGVGAAGLVALGLGMWTLSRNWRLTAEPGDESWWVRLARPRPNAAAGWSPNRLTVDPGLWLAERTLPDRRILWITVWSVAGLCFLLGLTRNNTATVVAVVAQLATCYAIKLWLAVVAPMSLNESRRSGALELLLCTPLSAQAIVRGQVETLVRHFAGPALLAAIGIGLFTVLGATLGYGLFGRGNEDTVAILNGLPFMLMWLGFFILDLYAIAYTGMWLGLTELRPGHAAARTIFLVLILPWISMVVPLLGCAGMIAIPVYWLVSSSRHLNERFREVVSGQYDSTRLRRRLWAPWKRGVPPLLPSRR